MLTIAGGIVLAFIILGALAFLIGTALLLIERRF
jgi:hypothetical protein